MMERVNIKVILDPNSILVVNQKGSLKKLYCPFRVISLRPIGNIPINSSCYVDQVFPDAQELIVYQIGNRLLGYSNFQIVISF